MMMKSFKKGQRVMYLRNFSKTECGVVSSTNDQYVFVKFDNLHTIMVTGDEPYTAQACEPHDLIFMPQPYKEPLVDKAIMTYSLSAIYQRGRNALHRLLERLS